MAKRALFLFLVLFLGLNAGLTARTLKVGVVDGLPGFKVENGRLQADSPHPEFIAALEKELRVKLVWSEYPTRRLLNMTEKGELDLIYPVGLSSERDAILKRSIPVYVTHDYFAYKTRPSNVADTSLTVGCRLGSPQENWLKAKGYKIETVISYESLIKMLLTDRVPMIALPKVAFDNLMSSGSAGTLLYEVSANREIGFYYTPKFSQADAFDKAIEKHRSMFKPD